MAIGIEEKGSRSGKGRDGMGGERREKRRESSLENVEELTLVLVDSLDLHVEQRIGVDLWCVVVRVGVVPGFR